ncbi:MAG: nucleotide exchange factor GrpE [Gemmatimonadales bacterium]
MRNSKKKGETPHRPDQLAQPDDYAAGGASQGDGQGGDFQGTDNAPDSDAGTAEPGADAIGGAADSGRTDSGPSTESDRYLRLAAEYDNYRKRSARERQDAGARAQADLVRTLVEALDDVARFAHVDPATTDASTIVQGVDMVEKKLLKALGSAGLEVINPVGETFDPALHEAVATEPTSAREDDHVVSRVYQPGYLFKSQLLRPARVVVKQWNG